jgi:hydroxyacylglutathione hydrolase
MRVVPDIIVPGVVGDNVVYLTALDDGLAFVIDPPAADPVMREATRRGLVIQTVLLTHHHQDHTAGCAELVARTHCRVIGPDDTRLPEVTERVADGDRITCGSVTLDVLAVPGHTRSHVAYYAADAGCAWTGDTLFVAGCGRLLEGTPEDMWCSLRRLRGLPDDTRIYCGHEYTVENLEFALHLEPDHAETAAALQEARGLVAANRVTVPSTMGREKRINPFLRADDPAMGTTVGINGDDPVAVFRELRRRKDRW